MTQRIVYAIAALVVLLAEVLIALFVNDAIVRPYGGDVLAVVLVYCALRAAAPLGVRGALVITLLVAGAIELAQLFNLLDVIGMRNDRIVRTVLGGSFDLLDLVAYAAGGVAVAVVEALRPR